jgi:hypothetical protein
MAKDGKVFELGDAAFDPETLAILEGVFDEAWAPNDGWFSQDAFAHGGERGVSDSSSPRTCSGTAHPKSCIRLSLSSIRPSISTENPIPEEMDHREIAVRVPVMNEVQFLLALDWLLSAFGFLLSLLPF